MRIIHLFNWNLKDIIPELENIKKQNFDAVLINPIQPLKEDNKDNWWLSYQPCGFNIGNQYGSKEDLKALCDYAWQYDIKILADVVCNHVAGANDGSLTPHNKVDFKLRENKHFFKEQKQIYDWNDRYQVTRWCMGLPGLDLSNQELQDIIFVFLNDLVDCGVSGFRLDAAKSIALPHEGNNFLEKISNMQKYFNLFVYGEVINASDYLIDQYANYINVTTNYYHGFKKDNIVAFVESHDCYLEFKHTNHVNPNEINNWYNSLSKEFINTIYYVRPYSNAWLSDIVLHSNNHYKEFTKTLSKKMS